MANEPEQKPLTFEQSLEQVQQIIDAIESGDVTLEQSIEQYAQGMQLVTRCRQLLDRAESKIKQLTIDEQGNPAESGEIQETQQNDS